MTVNANLTTIEIAIRYAGSDAGAAAKAELQSALRELEQLRALRMPFSVTPDEMSDAWHDTHDRSGQEPTREALNALLYNRIRPSAIETEVAAWRALAEWCQGDGEWRELDWPVELSEGEEPKRYGCRAHFITNDSRERGPYWYGEGPTTGAAVVSLARQLKLIPEAK